MEAADCAVDMDASQREQLFSRLKFLWHTRASTNFSDGKGSAGPQDYFLSTHDYQDLSLENDGRARSPSPLGLVDEPPTWELGSPWRYSAILDDFLNSNIGEEWQESNTLMATQREQTTTSDCHIFRGL